MADLPYPPPRAKAEYLGGTRVRFLHPCGHTSTKDFAKGRVSQRMGAGGVRLMARYWRDGVNSPCPKCYPDWQGTPAQIQRRLNRRRMGR